ncbi:MAG: quinone-dependent dihydroorotate dehydrogenase [Chitinophagaceae bacterium]
MYTILRNILFWFSPEWVHYFSMNCLKGLCYIPFIKKLLARSFTKEDSRLHKEFVGLTFKNPVGLAAGFDKNALYLNELETLGFGFVEIGTVTPQPQEGNEKPRLFRLPKDKALINRMGFNNHGVKVVAERLREWTAKNKPANPKRRTNGSRLIIGGNIGKNKITPNEDAWRDYEICFRELFDCVDYFVVNVSSPNTPGLRELQEKDSLRKILAHLQTINRQHTMPKPLLLKIAPDLTQEQIDDVIDLAMEIKLDGLVAANTTINRNGLKTNDSTLTTMGAGGLSGKPLAARATEIVQYIHQKTNGRVPVIASGGIFTAANAKEKLNAGAAIIQVWTGFIYEGPAIAKKICRSLLSDR